MKVSQPFHDDPNIYRIEVSPTEADAIVRNLRRALIGKGRPGPNIVWSQHVDPDFSAKLQFIIEEGDAVKTQ